MKKIICILLCSIMIFSLTACGESDEKKTAREKFETEAARIEEQKAALDEAVSKAEEMVKVEDKALDVTLKPALETAISDAKAAIKEIPKLPSDVEQINNSTEELKKIDYTGVTKSLTEASTALSNSIAQYKLVDNPEEAYIIQCLKTVDGVVDISAVTEDNDPNGNLNKAGGYTAQVYFSSNLIDQNSISGSSVIEKGTDCGGSIEVYKTSEEATNRETYLAAFDGSILSSGSHKVIGTVLIRTSNELTASQQKDLEAKIITALTTLK